MKEENIFKDIVLGQAERYDASKLLCIPFMKGTDVYKGIQLRLGNMMGGFPITVGRNTFSSSEALYLCGEFSNPTSDHLQIQKELLKTQNGFVAKKTVKSKHKDEIRPDFYDFSLQWMLWVVWQKTRQNREFQYLLLHLPKDCVIIEDSSYQKSSTAEIWGCKNTERKEHKNYVSRGLTEQSLMERVKCSKSRIKAETNQIMMEDENLRVGVYEGQNNMGKILMMCKRALENNMEPPINKDLLNESDINILGKRIKL